MHPDNSIKKSDVYQITLDEVPAGLILKRTSDHIAPKFSSLFSIKMSFLLAAESCYFKQLDDHKIRGRCEAPKKGYTSIGSMGQNCCCLHVTIIYASD